MKSVAIWAKLKRKRLKTLQSASVKRILVMLRDFLNLLNRISNVISDLQTSLSNDVSDIVDFVRTRVQF